MKCGAVFSFEATLSLLLFALMLTTLPNTQRQSAQELIITQQANDLLRVWSYSHLEQDEMVNDAKALFGESAEIWINGKKIKSAAPMREAIAAQGIILDEELKENTIKIIIYHK